MLGHRILVLAGLILGSIGGCFGLMILGMTIEAFVSDAQLTSGRVVLGALAFAITASSWSLVQSGPRLWCRLSSAETRP